MARINEAVHRILKVKYELGLFERPVGNPDDYPKFGSDEFSAGKLYRQLPKLLRF